MSEKVGRNDPCPCGSGLKYKKCHMKADQASRRERMEYSLSLRYVRQDLLEFAQDERFAIPFGRALSLFWNGHYTLENASEMSENEALRFFDWFAFDYQPEEGTRLLERYQEERGPELTEQQREIVAAWTEAGPASAYELTDYEGKRLFVRDFLTGEGFEVDEPAGRGAAKVGDLILARVLPVQDHLEFSSGAALIPQDEIADLRDRLEAARAADAEAHPEATAADFMRRHYYLLIHHALEQAEVMGRAPVARLAEA